MDVVEGWSLPCPHQIKFQYDLLGREPNSRVVGKTWADCRKRCGDCVMTKNISKPKVASSKFNRNLLPSPYEYYTQTAGYRIPNTTGWFSTHCPFHNDQNESFGINLDSGGFNCFACGEKGGDIITFHMKKHGLTFIQTINALGAVEIVNND